MWIVIILTVAIYLLFNVVIMLLCSSEQQINAATKALLVTLGLPIVIVLIVAAIIEGIRRR